MYIYENPNPDGILEEDCVVRAIAIAMDRSWYDVYVDLCLQGVKMSGMPSSNRVWSQYLKEQGYRRYAVPDTCPSCYTVRDFCGEFFKGTYILGTGTHAVCVIDGNAYDAWNSLDEAPIWYWTKEK